MMIPARSLRAITRRIPLPGQVWRPVLERIHPFIQYDKNDQIIRIANPQRAFLIRDEQEYIQRNVYFLNYYEIRETNYVRKILREGDVFVDIGANIGWFTVLASAGVGASGQVFAFEPSRRIHQHLADNVGINNCGNVVLERLALSDASGSAILANANPRNDGMGSIVHGGRTGEEVRTQTLDAYFEGRDAGTIDLVKLDVEGAEMFVLRGMRGLLAAGRVRRILFEYHRGQQAAAGEPPQIIFEFLREFGFEFHALNYFGNTRPLRSYEDLVYSNVVAMQPER